MDMTAAGLRSRATISRHRPGAAEPMVKTTARTAALFRLLGDEVRLRLLRVLSLEQLNVTELTGVLGLAQSGVSRHLGLLKDAGLVKEERDGGFSYYRVAPALDGGDAALTAVLRAQFDAAAADATVRADEARLQEVLRLRKENF